MLASFVVASLLVFLSKVAVVSHFKRKYEAIKLVLETDASGHF